MYRLSVTVPEPQIDGLLTEKLVSIESKVQEISNMHRSESYKH